MSNLNIKITTPSIIFPHVAINSITSFCTSTMNISNVPPLKSKSNTSSLDQRDVTILQYHLYLRGDKYKNPSISKDVDILIVLAESEAET